MKFPYLKNVGWHGLVDGHDSGVYAATPLARLNVSDSMATRLAQEHFEGMYETLGSKRLENGRYQPIHYRLATHWARLIELLYASERMLELACDDEIASPHVRTIPERITGQGVGCVEAPRGTLTHHYFTDENGVITKVNLIVGTTNNAAPIAMSVKRASERLISKHNINENGLLNKIEMAFRLYDPCFACATHTLPGRMPLIVKIKDSQGEIVKTLRRDG
jgi:F420-non-reducing hydrogenase large subunit